MIRQVLAKLGAVAQFEKAMLVAKLKGARDRKKRLTGKRGGRKSHRELNPEVVALARSLSRLRKKAIPAGDISRARSCWPPQPTRQASRERRLDASLKHWALPSAATSPSPKNLVSCQARCGVATSEERFRLADTANERSKRPRRQAHMAASCPEPKRRHQLRRVLRPKGTVPVGTVERHGPRDATLRVAVQCEACAGPFGAVTFRSKGTRSVAMTKAIMMARKASA
jgi:hypothetical protein